MHIDVGEGLRTARSDGFRQGRQQKETVPKGSRPFVTSNRREPNNTRGPDHDPWLGIVSRGLRRVALPTIALLALLAVSYLYRADPVGLFNGLFPGASAWLSLGALCIPLTFLVVHLANRRYGPATAAAQVLIAWLIVAVIAMMYRLEPSFEIAPVSTVSPRIGLALSMALLLSQLVAIIAFDAMRSIRWWTAPLHGFFWACLVFPLIFYPAAYLGTDTSWFEHFGIYFTVSFIVSVVLLLPYWVARPLVRPLPGLAGY